MQFHSYMLSKHCLAYPDAKAMAIDGFYEMCLKRMIAGDHPGDFADVLLIEADYVRCRRPFYNVYPAVQECLKNTRLDIELKQIEQLNETVAMCFAVGKEPILRNGKIAAMLVELSHKTYDIKADAVSDTPVLRIAADRIRPDGKRCFSAITCTWPGLISDRVSNIGDKRQLVSLAVGLAMLAQDQRFAEPILLKRDKARSLSGDELSRAIERAKRRGRNGMELGKGLEVSPHMRKPHFAIRWTGIGRKVPRLVPVKGCVVSRDKLFPVPTGYVDA